MTQFANMTLDDLKTGMIVTTRNGNEYTVIRDRVDDGLTKSDVIVRHDNDNLGWIPLSDYNKDLTCIEMWGDNHNWDIVKVEKGTHPFMFMDLSYRKQDRILLWKEPERVKLTCSEIENRLGYRIEIVSEEE